MMNGLALFLVLSSLTTATIWSKPPEALETERKKTREEEPVVKEAHRLIVVEYEKEIPLHPKASSQESGLSHKLPGGDNFSGEAEEEPEEEKGRGGSDQSVGDKLKEKAKEAASVLPNLGQGLSTPPEAPPAQQHVDESGKATDQPQEGFKHSTDEAKDFPEKVKMSAHFFKEEAKENMTEILKRGRDVARDAMRFVLSRERWAALMGVLRLLGFATAYGTCVWVTFVSSHVLSRALPRQQFGIVQSKVYPVYFKTMAYSILLSLGGLLLNPESRRTESGQRNNLLTSLVMVLVNLFYLEPRATKVMFEKMKMEKEEGRGRDEADIATEVSPSQPQVGGSGTAATTTTASAAGTESEKGGARKSREDEKSKKVNKSRRLNERLKWFNTQSSFLNILTLMDLTWHLVGLSQRLHQCQV